MFKQKFDAFAIPGESISCVVDGVTYTATLVPDEATDPSDFECYSTEQIDDYHRGGWSFGCVVLSAEKCGVALLDDYAHALWGCEYNLGDNGHLAETANELLQEAQEAAQGRLAELRASL
jgi:hypothetical protein